MRLAPCSTRTRPRAATVSLISATSQSSHTAFLRYRGYSTRPPAVEGPVGRLFPVVGLVPVVVVAGVSVLLEPSGCRVGLHAQDRWRVAMRRHIRSASRP